MLGAFAIGLAALVGFIGWEQHTDHPMLDMSFFKNFNITERVTFQFRAEAFNAFNTPIYQGPDTGLTSNSFGRVTVAQQNFPRSMQFAFRLSF